HPAGVLPERRLGVVRVEGAQHAGQAVEERRVGRGVDQALLVDPLQHRLRAVADGVPERRVELGEEGARRTVPAVPKVLREPFEASQALGNAGIDLEEVARSGRHGSFRSRLLPASVRGARNGEFYRRICYGIGTAARSCAPTSTRRVESCAGRSRCAATPASTACTSSGSTLSRPSSSAQARAECTSASAARGDRPATYSGERRVYSTIACT